MKKNLAFLALPLLLAGCGGGSGGPGGPDSSAGFLGFSQVKPNSTVRIAGTGVDTSFTADAGGTVTSVKKPLNAGDASADVTYDKDGDLTKVTLNGPTASHTWDQAAGAKAAEIDNRLIAAYDSKGADIALVGDADALGYEYQSFGAWQAASGTGGTGGALSVGAAMDPANVPKTGTATFKGTAAGIAVNKDGVGSRVIADATLTADFAAQKAAFSTSGSQEIHNLGTTPTLKPSANLDLDAPNLAYANGTFSGAVTNAGGGLSGTVTSRLYGPGIDKAEAGGVFSLTGNGVRTYVGAFGAGQ